MEFDEIYARYGSFVRRSILKLGAPETALDDIAQDVFLVVHRRLESFEGRASMKTWLFAIVRRVIADYRRTRTRREMVLSLALDGLDVQAVVDLAHAGPLDAVLHAEAVRAAHGILASMNEEHRRLFILAEI